MAKQTKNTNEAYLNYVSSVTPKSKQWKTLLMAFLVGGLFCIIGQAIHDAFHYGIPSMDEEHLSCTVSSIMIFLGATLTGIGIYDRIGNVAGAGSVVPITGFANSIVSPAMEFKSEGMVYGLAAKMFSIAGPIIVNGVTLSALVGLIYYIMHACGVAF